ncbi:MAG TPA: hypothetical protein VEQ60_20440, partial [Longimicrobium sp.]|nr:hypothetical protein [Longimicrobium sp.]
ARVVLLEEDPGLIARLGAALDDIGAGERVRASSDPAGAEPGEIVLVEGSFASHAHRLAQRIGDETALVRLAPLAARTLPWSALEPIVDLGGTDVLLRFPREDFEKQARFTGPLADLPPHLRRVVEGCSHFLSDERHGWLLPWRQAQRASGPDAALTTAIERMQAVLATTGDERVTHTLRVDGKTETVHLLLSTPFAEHPAELDGALADGTASRPKPASRRKAAASPKADPPAAAPVAVVEEPLAETPPPDAPPAPEQPATEPAITASGEPVVEPPPQAESSAAEASAAESPARDPSPELSLVGPPPAALDLFALAPQPEPEPRGPDLAALADDLHARHVCARVPAAELLAGSAEATSDQIRAALASLKRAGRVSYRSLDAEGAEVEFLAEPRVSTPRPRKPRTQAPGVLGLFDEPEE